MEKTLIAYFSRKGNNSVNGSIKNLSVGNTEVAAKMIQEITCSDLYYIEPETEYDADYTTCTQQAKNDLLSNVRPLFKNPLNNLNDYETIYLGYPNYWGTMPMHVWTFLEMYNFRGKLIKPFCTHEGSGMGRSEKDIKILCPRAKLESGLAIHGGSVSSSQSLLEKWI